MKRVLIFNKHSTIDEILYTILRTMPWLEDNPYFILKPAMSFLQAYKIALEVPYKFVCIPFHNVFQDLLMMVGKK